MSLLEILAERRILEAQRRGAFDGLRGRGQPLRLEPEDHVPPEWRAAFHILKQAGLAPDWIGLGAEIEAELAEARRRKAWRYEAPDAGSRHRVAMAALNEKIDRYNRLVPHSSLQRRRVRADDEG